MSGIWYVIILSLFPFHTVMSGVSAAGPWLNILLEHVAAVKSAGSESDWSILHLLSCFQAAVIGVDRVPQSQISLHFLFG